jgi:hypothetical protein
MDFARADGAGARGSRVCCWSAGGAEPPHAVRVAPGMLRDGGGGALDGHCMGEETGGAGCIGGETGIRIEGRGRIWDGGDIWGEGAGEEMGIWGAVEQLLGAERLCVSLLICGRGREECEEVLGVALLVLVFLEVRGVPGVRGGVERAVGGGLATAGGGDGARAGRGGGSARHGADGVGARTGRARGATGGRRGVGALAVGSREGERTSAVGGLGGMLRICPRPITSLRHITSSSWPIFVLFPCFPD